MIIYLDMDGVVTDFVGTYCQVFGLDEDSLWDRWPLGKWEMDEVLGISASEFYKGIDAHGESFWAEAKKYAHADELYALCESVAPTYILTAPVYAPWCVSGKLRWLQSWKGYSFRNYVLTPKKELCASRESVLIDDRELNVERFCQVGGRGIVFPNHTNSNYAHRHDALDYVKKILDMHRQQIDARSYIRGLTN